MAEFLAASLAVAYLLLIIRQNPLGWPAAIASACIYLVLMYQAGLYMQSALQAFYIVMASYGWWHWKRGDQGRELKVVAWKPAQHVLPLALIAVLGFASGYLLSVHSEAAMPYLDSLVAWGAIITTWMVARKVLQNWHYWFVIDAASIFLYASQGLVLTSLLFAGYLVLVVLGYQQWRSSMRSAHD